MRIFRAAIVAAALFIPALAFSQSYVAGGGSITISGKQVPIGGTYAPARSTTAPVNPTGTASLTQVMMGVAGSITPATSGNVLLTVSGYFFQTTATTGCTAVLRYGTGAAPVNGAALTGTVAGGSVQAVQMLASQTIPFAQTAYVTGLTPATAYWLDIGLAAQSGGTCTPGNVVITALEQ